MRSETTGEIASALALFQSTVEAIPKNRTANAGSYSYTYADLADIMAAIRKPLADNGLSVSQSVASDGGTVAVQTTVSHKSGEWMESDLLMLPSGNTPQTAGSALTYARRYSLSAMLGIVTDDDDDGNAAQQAVKSAPPSPEASESQRKAIFAIARNLGIEKDALEAAAVKEFGHGIASLTKSEASKWIERLKAKEGAS